VKDAWLNTTSGLVRQILLGVFSAIAEHERQRIAGGQGFAGLRLALDEVEGPRDQGPEASPREMARPGFAALRRAA
jgi:hypothetical protein